MKKPLILLAGKSGSGKDYIVKMFNLKPVVSRTTRAMRTTEINGVDKIFVTTREIAEYHPAQVIAYTKFSGHVYCALLRDLHGKEVYIIDPKGVVFFEEKVSRLGFNRQYRVIYVKCPWYRRLIRMTVRDGFIRAIKRLWNDMWAFWGFKYHTCIRN